MIWQYNPTGIKTYYVNYLDNCPPSFRASQCSTIGGSSCTKWVQLGGYASEEEGTHCFENSEENVIKPTNLTLTFIVGTCYLNENLLNKNINSLKFLKQFT